MHGSRLARTVALGVAALVVTLGPTTAVLPVEAAVPVVAPEAPPPAAAPPSQAQVPDITVIRACLRSIRTLGECASTAAFAACAATYSKLLGCARKAYSAYKAYDKVRDFQSDPACPASLYALADYVCRTRPPPAPRAVSVTVTIPTLRVHTGPATSFTYAGYYSSGQRLGVVCVALGGERFTLPDGRWDYGWDRLTNGYFVPRIGVSGVGNVPYC